MKHIIMSDSANVWSFSVEPFPAYRINLVYGRNKRDREFLPVQGINFPATFRVTKGEFMAENRELYVGSDKQAAEKAKVDYEALPPLFQNSTAKPEMVKRTAKIEEVTSTPIILPEGQFRLITTQAKGTKLIVPGRDETNDVLLFVGCGEGFRGGVSLVQEATTGEIVKTCQAGNATGGRIEVIVRLKVGQSIGFHSWGRRTNEVYVLSWDGQKIIEKHYSKEEWELQREISNPALPGQTPLNTLKQELLSHSWAAKVSMEGDMVVVTINDKKFNITGGEISIS